MRFTLCMLFALSLLRASAATYYIDYAGGSDANAGTSTGAAWKRCPGMYGFTGSYSHAAGDRFIFKGGVTWPNGVFGLVIANNGGVGNEDYYGVDEAWYSGAAWSHPVFDGEGTALPNTGDRECLVLVTGDNISLDRLLAKNTLIATNSYMYFYTFLAFSASNITFSGCIATNWIVETLVIADCGGFGNYNGSGITTTNCTASGPLSIDAEYVSEVGWATDDMRSSGYGFWSISTILNCVSEHTTQGAWNPMLCDGLEVRYGGNDFNSGSHENAVNCYGSTTVRNCYVHHWKEGTTMFCVPGWGDRDGVQYWYNNIIHDSGPVPFSLSESGIVAPTSTQVHIYNNTILEPNTIITESDRANPSIAVVRIQNNLFITDGSSPISITPVNPDQVIANNYSMTTADAATYGLTTTNLFEPSSAITGVADVGLDLSAYFATDYLGNTRPVGAWDIGAYEYGEGGGVDPETGSASVMRVGGAVRAGSIKRW
jgi:hypothetical protein